MNYIVDNVPEISRACRAFNDRSHLVTSTRNSRATFAYSLASVLSSRELSGDPALLAARTRFSILLADFCARTLGILFFLRRVIFHRLSTPSNPISVPNHEIPPRAPSVRRETRPSLSLSFSCNTAEFNCHPLRPFDSPFDLRSDSATLHSRPSSRHIFVYLNISAS